ncbi:ABC transporter permease [Mesorhizobium loti]|nr:ABC transporter permease [Mesorhizobium loti]PLP57303.1 ABC transporter permease [Mesorhizobium loti]
MASVDLKTGVARDFGEPAPTAVWLRAQADRAGRLIARLLVASALPVALGLLWQVAADRAWVSAQVLPPPAWVLQTSLDLVSGGEIVSAVAISFTRIAYGLLIGASLGFLFGLLIGFSRRADQYFGATFRAIATVPSLGWLPILILLLGIDESLKIVILAKACFVPMAIGIAEGVRNIPPALKEVADVLALPPRTRFLKLTLPAIVPFFFTGLRLSTAQAFVSLIVVEMLAGTDGIGYLMVWGRTLFQLDIVIVGMLVVGVAGFLLDVLLRRLEAHFAAPELRHG